MLTHLKKNAVSTLKKLKLLKNHSISFPDCLHLFESVVYTEYQRVASIWFENWGLWARCGSYKFNFRRRIAQDLGYQSWNFYLIYMNLYIYEKSPIWKVISSYISVCK